MFFLLFFQKSLFTENYFLIAAINLATLGPLYTCLVWIFFAYISKTFSMIFLKLCITFTIYIFERVTRPDFSKKKICKKFQGKSPIFEVFGPYLKDDSNEFSESFQNVYNQYQEGVEVEAQSLQVMLQFLIPDYRGLSV